MTLDHRITFPAFLIATTGFSGILTGCSPPLNATDGLLGESALPAVTGEMARAQEGNSRPVLGGVVPFDRSTWKEHSILIDRAQVQHHPSYGSSTPPLGTPKSVDAWPTIRTAFETDRDGNDDVVNGILAPLAAGLELIVLPFRMITDPPCSIVTSPRGPEIMPPCDDAIREVRTDWLQMDTTAKKESS